MRRFSLSSSGCATLVIHHPSVLNDLIKLKTLLLHRCFITLTTALHYIRGGRLQGPTGTGKSETVKDLGKCMAYLMIITNCSESLDYKSLGRLFSGKGDFVLYVYQSM